MVAGFYVALAGAGLIVLVLGAILMVGNAWARLGALVVGLASLGYGSYLYFLKPHNLAYDYYLLIAPGLVVIAQVTGAIVRRYRATPRAEGVEALETLGAPATA
ncbi:MAG: hypothetical protein FWF90_01055 [Promicromonosporaceae bacterium]|nr:hypothetical protein [Promicromonosporaceae bacterium]